MRLVRDIDLIEFGDLCGIVGNIDASKNERLYRMLTQLRPGGLLCYFRGAQDIAIAEVVLNFTETHKYCRSVIFFNSSIVLKASPHVQVKFEQILEQMDMAMQLNWDSKELPIAVAIRSSRVIIGKETGLDIRAILNELGYAGDVVYM